MQGKTVTHQYGIWGEYEQGMDDEGMICRLEFNSIFISIDLKRKLRDLLLNMAGKLNEKQDLLRSIKIFIF